MADVVEHLESHLGPIDSGWPDPFHRSPRVNVVRFAANRPFTGVTTLATLGLSNHHLTQSGGRGLHQELLVHLPVATMPANAAAVLFQVAGQLLYSGEGLLRGEVLGPSGALFGTGQLTALYAAPPVYLPDEFAMCATPRHEVVLTWLIPITAPEARLVAARGWRALEDAFFAEDPDLTDLTRGSVAAAH